jgi:hypothetical protein
MTSNPGSNSRLARRDSAAGPTTTTGHDIA